MDGTFLNPSTMETKTVQDQPELLSETLLGCGNSPQAEETAESHQMQFLS